MGGENKYVDKTSLLIVALHFCLLWVIKEQAPVPGACRV